MVLKSIPNLKEQKGVTLIELIIVIAVIVLLSMILVANFPEIQRRLSLSRAAYKLAQDFRRTEDLALSGSKVADINGETISEVDGYGIYFDLLNSPTGYTIYADTDNGNEYSIGSSRIIDMIDLGDTNRSLFIKGIYNITTNQTSINFTPPNPTVIISNLNSAAGYSQVEIVLGLKESSQTRKIIVNTSGAISVE